MSRTRIEDGVYVLREHGQVIIHLNTANEAEGNGVNLMPAAAVAEPDRGRKALTIRRSTLLRIYEAMFEDERVPDGTYGGAR